MKTILVALLSATGLASPALASASDCAFEITTVIGAALTSGPLRVGGLIPTPAGDITMEAEVVPPGTAHMITAASGQSMEMIIIGRDSWIKSEDTWLHMGGEASIADTFGTPDPEQLKTLSAEQCLGTQMREGVELLAYTFDMEANGIAGAKHRLFADPATKRPVRIEADIAGEQTSMVFTYEYDASIVVVAPL